MFSGLFPDCLYEKDGPWQSGRDKRQGKGQGQGEIQESEYVLMYELMLREARQSRKATILRACVYEIARMVATIWRQDIRK